MEDLRRFLKGLRRGFPYGNVKFAGVSFALQLRVSGCCGIWEFPKIRGTVFWGPYKDPTI